MEAESSNQEMVTPGLEQLANGDTKPEEGTLRLQMTGQPTAGQPGKFEIVAITAGSGNGWQFSEDVLKASLSLWAGAEVFIDHSWWSRSVRDLGGVVFSPEWDAERKGVKLQLKAAGPSGQLLEAIGRDWLAAPEGQRPRVGFSADIFFTSRGREVLQIARVNSLDLVFNPARGGIFLRALNQKVDSLQSTVQSQNGGMFKMDPEEDKTQSNTVQAQLQADQAAVQTLLNVQREQQALAEEAEKARAVRAQMCGYLLESGLSAAKLPAAMAEHVRKQFTGQVFEPGDLTAAIEDARKLTAELQGGAVVSGARVHGMLSSEDRLQAAVDDLLGAPREKAMEGKQVEHLQGIRELYMLMTGDFDLHGGYYADRAQLATTSTMAGLVKNALNKSLVNQWEELGRAGYRWWEKVVTVEHFNSLNDITGVLVGEVGLIPVVAEAGPYTELNIEDSPEVASFTKYGGYLPLTLELIDRDDVTKLKTYPRKLANSSLRRVSSLVSAVFTAGGGVGPLMADAINVFDAVGHGNLGVAALDSASWEAANAAIYDQEMLVFVGDTAPKLAVDAKYLLVPRALRLTAMQLLYPNFERTATFFTENMQKGEDGDVITVPDWTDAKDWAAVANPKIAPAIYVGERFGLKPEIFIAGDELSPAMFTNDEMRLKIRHFLAVMVADYRPLYKANVP